MSKIRLSFGNISLVLALGALVVSAGDVRAQKSFRGTAIGAAPLLSPPQPIPCINNGSLMTWMNPMNGQPGQIPFTNMASLPLGDRLMTNGITYDTSLIPNLNQGMPNQQQQMQNATVIIINPLTGAVQIIQLGAQANRNRLFGSGGGWNPYDPTASYGYNNPASGSTTTASTPSVFSGFASLGTIQTPSFSASYAPGTLGSFVEISTDNNPFAADAFSRADPQKAPSDDDKKSTEK